MFGGAKAEVYTRYAFAWLPSDHQAVVLVFSSTEDFCKKMYGIVYFGTIFAFYTIDGIIRRNLREEVSLGLS